MLLIAAGLLWFGQISPDGSYLTDLIGPMLLAAVGLGFSFVPQTIAAVSGVAEHEAGLASGLINTSQQVGGALGLAVLSTVAFNSAGSAQTTDRAAALVSGYTTAFTVGGILLATGAALILVLIRRHDVAHIATGEVQPALAAA
jgi:hypothetical protein